MAQERRGNDKGEMGLWGGVISPHLLAADLVHPKQNSQETLQLLDLQQSQNERPTSIAAPAPRLSVGFVSVPKTWFASSLLE